MGYTHYFKTSKHFSDKVWGSICEDTKKILANMPYGIKISGCSEDLPIVNDSEIRINGVKDEAHETFTFRKNSFNDFCKTNRKPYDLAACSILLVASYHDEDGGLSVGSDGLGETYADSEWVDAVNLVHQLFPTYGMDNLFRRFRDASMLEIECEKFMLHRDV